MEVKDDAPTTTPFGRRETTEAEERGAGGKLKKPSARRPPATPYTRPPKSLSQRGRWLSRLVDPARHLISGLPSIFSRPQSPASADLPAQTVQEQPHDKLDTEVEDEEQGNVSGNKDGDSNLNQVVSVSENVAGTSRVGDALKSSLDLDSCEQRQEVDTSEHVKLSHIEQLLNGRRFSRAEVDRLIEIIRSRSVDFSDVVPELASRKTGSTQEGLKILDRAITGTGTGTLSPLHQSMMQCDVGNSPVEIARAYMKNRISEPGFGSHSVISKDEGKFGPSDELIPSPYPKPAACWPGAVVQDQRHFMTPQNERRRIGLHNFPRPPYSRTTYSKPKSKLIQFKGDGEKRLNLMPTPFEQSRGPVFGGVNSPANAFDGGYGSVGPIHGTKHRVDVETPRISSDFGSFRSSNFSSAQVENSNASHGFFSTVSENLEAGTSSSSKLPLVHTRPHSSEVGVPTVPTHSSQMAWKILEHLDRNPPTPKDKSAELKLAISWKKPDIPNTTFNILKKQNNSDIGYLVSSDKEDHNLKNSTLPLFGGKEVSHLKVLAVEAANEPNNSTSASSMNVGRTSSHLGASPDFRKYQDSQIMGKQEDVSRVASNASSSHGMQKKPPLSGTRPALPAISISKPDQKWAFPSDNSSGFTFPVSASSGALYEPPTPSIAPSSSVSGQDPQKEVLSIPSYSFGSSRSTPALVFSFPSTSNSPLHNDTPDPKFTFGSNQGTRISFSSIVTWRNKWKRVET